MAKKGEAADYIFTTLRGFRYEEGGEIAYEQRNGTK